MNWIRTTLLLGGLTALLLVVGRALGGEMGMIIALGFAIFMNFSAYWYSDKIVLKMYNAQPVTADEAPELYDIVKELASASGLPMPKVYIINDETPNAFATGRNPENAAVAVNTGLLRILNREELKGVLSHELSHVQNRDTLTSAIAATIAGAITTLANFAQFGMMMGSERNSEGGGGNVFTVLLMMILAPIAATLIQLAVSRSREYGADESGARISHDPMALANALRKLESANQQMPSEAAAQHPATAHMFIVNPLTGKTFASMFSTHPPIAERIRRLEEMARSGDYR